MKRILITAAALSMFASCKQEFASVDTAKDDSTQQGQAIPVTPAPATPTTPAVDPNAFNLKEEADFYKQRYSLKDPNTKLVSDSGKGYEKLYGVRNLRVVLHGVYYRGGANNLYNREGKRDNMNPLPTTGLKNLCAEGFSGAIYLYPTNYSTAPKLVNCKNIENEDHRLDYYQKSAFSVKNHEPILQLIFDRIKGKSKGPLYGHCWNGWHASGLIASMALRQWCGYTEQQAYDYWIKNTDGNSSGYDSAKALVRAFKPIAKFNISKTESEAICPQ